MIDLSHPSRTRKSKVAQSLRLESDSKVPKERWESNLTVDFLPRMGKGLASVFGTKEGKKDEEGEEKEREEKINISHCSDSTHVPATMLVRDINVFYLCYQHL